MLFRVFFENRREVLRGWKSQMESDFGYGSPATRQQLLRAFDFFVHNIFSWAHAGLPTKFGLESRAGKFRPRG